MWFNTPILVPTRPCQPSIPTAYEGPKIDWWITGTYTLNTINLTSRKTGYGILDRMDTAIMAKPSLNSGFVQVAPDM